MNNKQMGIITQLWKLQSIWMFQRAVGSSLVYLCWTLQAGSCCWENMNICRVWEAGESALWGFGTWAQSHLSVAMTHILLTNNRTACAVISVHLPNSVTEKQASLVLSVHSSSLASVGSNRKWSLLACEDLLPQTCVFTRAPHQEQR